ncbi:SRPBCC family protein [Allonocardiopsis opalescens]|uniref:Uncharacterized protein YndB with AHSA1/START domain n=1 Tax=Allonocardiopsis opalescens TaxID=1144618 RepID=A0A2T0PXL8_9ACTN|nr:SRPBCC domain-containing protein [Allonocardiopsis opalescens]PRX96290.1 uncharacterized protein YndB with AHSA1/START domain [Allonocardiopsis opalescens]
MREVGRTRDVGYQIGVSRTVPHPAERVWRLLTSPGGLALWLGDGARLTPERGAPYTTADGTRGEVRSYRENDRIRLTWRPPGWSHDTTLQVALSGAGERTAVHFHQEWLADAAERTRQREHWKGVVDRLAAALEADRA